MYCWFCGKTEHAQGEYHTETPEYLLAVLIDHALLENEMTTRQRKDGWMRAAYWAEYIRQGAPKNFEWPLERNWRTGRTDVPF